MESSQPMERLLCGDVGFGKTEVAIRAAFKCVLSGYQVAILVPTTLLAEQHYFVFRERIADYPVIIEMFSRFRSRSQIQKDLKRLKQGEIDIAIGTHRLFSKDVEFKKLGLLIIDEEHRFGVRHKEKLRKIRTNVDTLYMSATPIPRTMYFALSRLKEMSLIQTSPKARLPIRTVIIPFDEDVIKDAINREVVRGGQVFFVHNRVKTIDTIASKLRKLMPNIKFAIGHGQLREKQLEKIMLDFAHHKFDVLIASSIIESGIDIPNANTIIVNRADMFGLAQLYQIRGRVGRSNRRAYAYFIIPKGLTEIARKRLETLTEYDSLGSGYQIAMKDLELRGAGSLLGTKQSGVINTIGFNYYNRLLEKAINSFGKKDFTAEVEEESVKKYMYIDEDFYFHKEYIKSDKEQYKIYKKMLNYNDLKLFEEIKAELSDRFGPLPEKAENNILFYKIRFLARELNVSTIKLEKNRIEIEFEDNRQLSKNKLTNIIKNQTTPIRFDTVNNFAIIADLKKNMNSSKLLKQSFSLLKTLY